MSINQKQYQQLTEMGISLWQRNTLAFESSSSTKESSKHKVHYLKQDIDSLSAMSKQTFFTDVLRVLELSVGEVTAQQDHLDLGLFNWFFYADQNATLSIHCSDNKLVTPNIELIQKSHALKKQLWQTIATKLL